MASNPINIDEAHFALELVKGTEFEKFFLSFYPAIAGEEFIPQGGTKDGGADAFLDEKIFKGKQTECFYQASVVEDYLTKIRKTAKRLTEFGRKPNTLIYVTSRKVKHIDLEEAQLGRELRVNIKIRDETYICSNINNSIGTRAAFETYLRPLLEPLKRIGSSNTIPQSKFVSSPAVFVFLRQELERHHGKLGLINSLADGLILWALESTDPDQELFMTQKEIIEKIENAVPASRTILHGVFPSRLKHLSKELHGSARLVRWYRKQGYYCLSYEIRKYVEKDNADDEALRIFVLDVFETRISDKFGNSLNPRQRKSAAEISLQALHRTFESEGIELAAFLQSKIAESTPKTLSEHVDNCMIEQNIRQEEFGLLKDAILENLRGAFYDSTEEERVFFSKLSATYTLLFCLNTEPRIVEYFQNMAADFYLYVGSDILIGTISEKYLRQEDQMITNTLKIIRDAGGKLILTEQVLDEVHSHFKASDYEFINNYKSIEPYIDNTIARNSDRILIRAYFYAKLLPPTGMIGPKDWADFVNQVCDYRSLHYREGYEQIKLFLQAKFNMDFKSAKEISSLCEQLEVEELSSKLQAEKRDNRLARNDATLALAVYGRRRRKRESSIVSEFGFRTWWLTGESRILKHTENLQKKHGALYMMRPEFVLNFLTLTPSAVEVRHTYQTIFPSLLGIQLARRIAPQELSNVLQKFCEAQGFEPARRTAVISQLSNKLKGDFLKRYPHSFNNAPNEYADNE